MSSLKWQVDVYLSRGGGNTAVPTNYWALWTVGEDQTAWYNMPCAQIRKLKEGQWELSFPDRNLLPTQCFTTLKEAKAMGIALVRMDDAV
jgi:hypothetical protein